ncbi:MAG: hypothetical protein IKX68_08025 [Clostridiales bacterium]|nr:hypothetical protein [Clostridiales bacterium]
MKKIVAVLLCAATLMGCVACSKSEETTKKKKKKTKKTTEITETEETEVPSDTPSSETETEPTNTQPQYQSDLVITHDLSGEEIKSTSCVLAYGAIDANEEDEYLARYPKRIRCQYELMNSVGSSPNVNAILEELTYHEAESVTRVYEKELEEFTGLQESGSPLYNYSYCVDHDVIRADSQILSIKYNSTVYDSRTDESYKTAKYLNYNSADGTAIENGDVIVNMDEFILYYKGYCQQFGLDPSNALEQIENGEFTFGLTYDGIIVDDVKIPVYTTNGIFNMSYFGATPKTYTLTLEKDHWLMWDINDDGQMDKLGVSVTKNGYEVESLTITMYGEEYTFQASEFDEMEYMEDLSDWADSCVMSVNGKLYLLVVMDWEGEDYMTYAFDINGDQPVFTDFMYSAPYDTTDPNHFHVDLRQDIMGTQFYEFDYALSEDGGFLQLSMMGRIHSGLYITTIALTGNLYNITTGEKGEEFEIAGGTPVEVIAYDVETGDLIVRLHSKYDDLDLIDVALSTDKRSKIAGIENNDAFLGLSWAD